MDRLKYLSKASRGQLIDLMISLNIKFDFDSPNCVFIDLIREHLNNEQKVVEYKGSKYELGVEKIISVILFTLLVICFFVVIIMGIMYTFPSSSSFCDNKIINNSCVKCPSRAECTNGRAECPVGYTLIHYLCIVDDGDKIFVSGALEYALESLSKRAGQYRCGLSEIDYYHENELETLILKYLHMSSTDKERIINKTIPYLEYADIEIFIQSSGTIYVSKNVIRPLSCTIKYMVLSHIEYLVSAAIILLSCIIFIWIKYRNTNQKEKAYFIANEIINMFKGERRSVTQQQVFAAMNKMEYNIEQIWPLVLTELSKNPHVTISKHGDTVTFMYN